MKKKYILLLLLAMAVAVCSEAGSSAAASSKAKGISVRMTVIDPEPADWPDFPATCALLREGSPDCTCVLVGPQAALTARHCVVESTVEVPEEETRARQVLLFGNSLREGACSVAPIGLDLAICHMGEEPVTNIKFENLGAVPTNTTTLLLTGFGCASFAAAHGGFTLNKLLIEITNLQGDSPLIGLDDQLLCGGDSGGPGYVLLPQPVGSRRVVGINGERVNLTRVSTPAAESFLTAWASRNNTGICGLTPGAQDCRP